MLNGVDSRLIREVGEGVICGFGHRRRLTLNGGGVEDLNCVAVNPLGEGDGSRMERSNGFVKRYSYPCCTVDI